MKANENLNLDGIDDFECDESPQESLLDVSPGEIARRQALYRSKTENLFPEEQ